MPRTPLNRDKSDQLIRDTAAGMTRLREIMARLRDPQEGCPWDLAQDFADIAPYTIEEAYEVEDAIKRSAFDELKSELGDLLFQSVFHARIAEERGLFDLDDVINAISDKMLSRHPHVFGDESNQKSADQQVADWESLKAQERGEARILDGVALGLPALTRAVKLQKRAARVGFDWPSTAEVLDKIKEEAAELVEAKDDLTQAEVVEEYGDLMFVMANLARHLQVDPELALRAANDKFTNRFNQVEDDLKAMGKHPSQSDLAEMDALWDKAKAAEKAKKALDKQG